MPLFPGGAAAPGPAAPDGTDRIAGILGTIPAGSVPAGPKPHDLPASHDPNAAFVPGEGAGDTPQHQYQAAFELIGQGHYAESEKAFRAFLAEHPKDPLAGSAAYWLAESYYVRGDFTNSAVNFGEAYRKYPTSTKAPDTLLKLGLSLAQLGRKDDACTTFTQLGSQFPAASASIKRQSQQEKTRLKCA
jgi:tol-pal system protein YbgF